MIPAQPQRRRRSRYRGPLVIRTPVPEGAIDLCKVIDAERAAQRRADREAAWRASWRGRLHRAAAMVRSCIA